MAMLSFQTGHQMPGTRWGAPSFWLGALWGGHAGQVPATFCSGLPNDAFGKGKEEQKRQRRNWLVCSGSVAGIIYPVGGRFPWQENTNQTWYYCLPGEWANLLCECTSPLPPWDTLMSWNLLGLCGRCSHKFCRSLSFLAIGNLICLLTSKTELLVPWMVQCMLD